MLNRRAFIRGGTMTAALLLGGGASAAIAKPGKDWFDEALVIDGLGGLGNPGAADGITRLTDENWNAYRATGVTATRVTVMPVAR